MKVHPTSSALRESVALSVARLGGQIEPEDVVFEFREWRWLALLPRHVVFAADHHDGWSRLEKEATVMARFRACVGGLVPAVLARDCELRFQVRERIDGISGADVERLVAPDWGR